MKLIIIGATGFIGGAIYRYAKKNNITVLGTTTREQHNEFIKFDISKDDPKIILANSEIKPCKERVCAVLAASICNINECFQNQVRSEAVNITGTKRLLDYFHNNNIKTAFLSSDIVFDGKKGNYTENDKTGAMCVYAQHKQEIERYIEEKYPEFLIYRLTKTVSKNLENKHVLRDIYQQQKKSEMLNCIQGNKFCICAIEDTTRCIVQGLSKNLSGLYNLTNPEQISRYELTKKILKNLKSTAKAQEIPLAEFNFREPMPLNTTLCVDKLAKVLDLKFTSIDRIVAEFVKNCKIKQEGDCQ